MIDLCMWLWWRSFKSLLGHVPEFAMLLNSAACLEDEQIGFYIFARSADCSIKKKLDSFFLHSKNLIVDPVCFYDS